MRRKGTKDHEFLFRLEPVGSTKYLTAIQRLNIAAGAAEGRTANISLK